MKGRPRGESDLGRPNAKPNGITNGYAFSSVAEGNEPGGSVFEISEKKHYGSVS